MSVIYDYAASTWQEFRQEYESELQEHYDSAVLSTGGVLLNDAGLAAGIHSWRLFSSDPTYARKYASEALVDFWKKTPRPLAASRERAWFSERLGASAPGLVHNSDSAIFSWATMMWKKCRSDYEDELERQLVEVEHAVNSAVCNKRGREAHVSTWDLMTRNMGFVRAYASEELVDYWQSNRRLTFAVFERQWFDSRVSDGGAAAPTLFD